MTGFRLFLVAIAGLTAALASAQFYSAPKGSVPGSGRTMGTNPAIRIDQRLNAVVSPDLVFTDSTGKKVTTGEVFSERPTLLLMIFYKCTSVCAVEMVNLKKTIRGMLKDDASRLYDVVLVSIDPTESHKIAATARNEFIASYKRPGTDSGFKFLVGDAENIDRLAEEVGFRFYRDPKNGRITHPAGLMVLSPERRICRYFLDQEFSAKMIQMALKDARDEVVGEKDDRPFFLACIDIDPLTGQRSINVLNTIRTGGVATILVLIVSIIFMNRGAKANQRKMDSSEAQND